MAGGGRNEWRHYTSLCLTDLLAQLVVADDLEGAIQRLFVVAAVVDRAVGRGVGELVRADEVAATDLDRIQPEGARHLLSDPLGQEGRLRAAGAAIGAVRRRGGVDGEVLGAEGREAVGGG